MYQIIKVYSIVILFAIQYFVQDFTSPIYLNTQIECFRV